MTTGATLATADAHLTKRFTLPLAWRAADGQAADQCATVHYDDLSGALQAVFPTDGNLPAALLAAHLTVLGKLTEEPAFRTDVVAPPHPVRSLSAILGAPSWRMLVAEVAEAMQRPGTGADQPDPTTASQVRFEFCLDADHEPTRDERYGLRVVTEPQALRLHVPGGAVTPDDLARLVEMYRTVLVTMVQTPDADPSQTPLPAQQQATLLSRWALGAEVKRRPESLIELIEAQVDRTPEAIAVETAQGSLTYQELDQRANQVGHYLLRQGIGREDLVGVCLRRSPDLLPVLLGVWKAGAGYLPLDPDLPAARRQRMVGNAQCRLVVTTNAHLGEHAAGSVTELPLERLRPELERCPANRPGGSIQPGQIAYVMYTSGSTGNPKGVMVEHGGLHNYLLWTLEAYASQGAGGSAYMTSISFDLGMPSLFTPLLAGQRVHLLPDPSSPADLGEQLTAGAPYSFLKITPGHLNLLSLDLEPEQAHHLAGLVIAAGDAFPTSLASRWRQLAGEDGTGVATEYGPTEVTVGNSGQIISALPETELIPLGPPIPGTSMYVLTEDLQPTPIGVPGEVYIGGEGVARGYLNDPALTAARFVPDPYGSAGSRLYRTGDRARWLASGELDFLGRVDHQVKIRGHRVELAEVQAALHRHHTVSDAVAIAVQPPGRSARLAAFIIPAPGHNIDARVLRRALRDELPDFMAPTDIVAVDEFPLTANGKVDVRALQSRIDPPTN